MTAISSTNAAQDHKAAVKGVLAPRSLRKSSTTSRTLMTAIVAIVTAAKAGGAPFGRAGVKMNMQPVRARRSSKAREQFGRSECFIAGRSPET